MSPTRKTRSPRTERTAAHAEPKSAVTRRRALLSVADKQGLTPFAAALEALGFEILSTGGTAKALRAAGIAVTDVATITGFPEIMDGRVKTLHPHIHGGLLARRGVDDAVLESHGIGAIDLLVVNLYPFEATTARPDCTDAEAIENIDVGGPAMLRAAAKNHEHIAVVVDPADYEPVLAAIKDGGVPPAMRRQLAIKAFSHTARYDTAISHYLRTHSPTPDDWANPLLRSWDLLQPLRYGENPHQRAALYRTAEHVPGSIAHARQLQGKELSFNNLVDADAAYQAVKAFDAVACVIVKHANPCGIATAVTPVMAYQLAYRADPTSAFGGVIAFNRPLDQSSAEAIVGQQFAEVVIAPEVGKAALAALAKKQGIRVLEAGWPTASAAALSPSFEWKTIEGGLLVQTADDGRVDVAAAKVVDATPADGQRATRPQVRVERGEIREIQRDRAGARQCDDRHRRRPAEPRHERPHRGTESRGSQARRGGLRARVGRVLSVSRRHRRGRRARRGRRRATRRLDARRRSHTRRRRAWHDDDLHGHAALSPLTTTERSSESLDHR